MRALRPVVDSLTFAEGPRWHDGALYVSDMHAGRVLRIGNANEIEVVAQLDDATSGLGWLPDGRLLVVSMHARKVMRREHNGAMAVHGDLNKVATFHANDMVVTPSGIAYVGNFGFSIFPLGDPRSTSLACVAQNGTVTAVAEDLWFPNGIALTHDGRTLVVAETAACRLSAFKVNTDGTLSDRRVWATFGDDSGPDGLCLDADGAAWVAIPRQRKFVRVREGGELLETIPVEHHALACVLGGPHRHSLYLTMSPELEAVKCLSDPSAKIMVTEVDVPGDGWP